jgi:hypothetical protein
MKFYYPLLISCFHFLTKLKSGKSSRDTHKHGGDLIYNLFLKPSRYESMTKPYSKIASMQTPSLNPFQRFARLMGWTKSSYVILGIFLLTVFVIIYVWWPLAQMVLSYIDWQSDWWRYFDWLLVGIFLFMSLVIMAGADLRKDALIILVGAIGGLVIEAWGTQTYLWWYFTDQRPPLWIIPAWPIANLTIDRMVRFLIKRFPVDQGKLKQVYRIVYWVVFLGFTVMMLFFVWPTLLRSMTLIALVLVIFLVVTPTDHRFALLTFLAGGALGWFLEYWGTTRECWTYYTLQTPPLFAVLAHGMAAVAFWRSGLVLKIIAKKILKRV